jgi:hypothetical protein
MLELIGGILLAAGAVYFVLQPILRPGSSGGEERDAGSVDEGDDPDDDFSPRAVALRALKEIEFDRATGKLSDADFDKLKTKYTTEALAALRVEQPGSGKREAAPPFPVSRVPSPVCPTHGPRRESDAAFCSECGRRLATAPGYCARCGSALEHDAHYCHSCGARVAA